MVLEKWVWGHRVKITAVRSLVSWQISCGRSISYRNYSYLKTTSGFFYVDKYHVTLKYTCSSPSHSSYFPKGK